MESAECSYEGCHNNRHHLATGLCVPHRRVQLREGELRPLRPRSRVQSPTCTGPECSRPSEAHDLCKQHGQQLRTGRPLHVIGDSRYKSQRQREVWHSRTPEQQAQWIAGMQAGLPKVQSEETARKKSVANRAAWVLKLAAQDPFERACLTCGTDFMREHSRQFYCSVECRRLYAVLRRHGLTFRQYADMIKAQDGKCAVCRGAWKGWSGQQGPHIDHCHETGRVRGLLCGDCNTALGRFGDDPVLLRRAADYLDTTPR